MLSNHEKGRCDAEMCWEGVCGGGRGRLGAIVQGTGRCQSNASYVVSVLLKKMN